MISPSLSPSDSSGVLMERGNARMAKKQVQMIFPASMPLTNATGTLYHPEYLFCGECTACADDPVDTDQGDCQLAGIQIHDGKEGEESQVRTRIAVDNLNCPSHVLVIQSVLQELPGVLKVIVNLQDKLVFVDHEYDVSEGQLVEAIQQLGFHAQPNENCTSLNVRQPTLCRSQFYVQGICCASETPVIRKIIKTLPGVSKLQINISTKMVYVHHDPKLLGANEIAMILDSQGFKARVCKNGAEDEELAVTVGCTILRTDRALHQQDLPPIQKCLSQLDGVNQVRINVSDSAINVEHDVGRVSAETLQKALESIVSTTISSDANDDIAFRTNRILSSARSKYVESTLVVSNLTLSHVAKLEQAFRQNYIRAQLRAFYPHVPSRTLKLEHDPRLLRAETVAAFLVGYGLDASIAVDGAVENLALPLMDDYESSIYGGMELDGGNFLHLNVMFSGIFWVISMLSIIGGDWEYLKYAGLLSVLFGLPPVALKAGRTIRRCQFDANCMMVVAALGSLALQEYDEAASVAFLFSVSEFLESRASAKARKALGAIVSLRPDHANVIHPVTNEIVIVPADKVPVGSLISVRTGDKIAADGVVVDGTSTVDESSLTGEAVPVTKHVKDAVAGGSINIGETQLVVKTTCLVENSAVSRLIRLVEEAQSNRSPTEKLVDAFARTYTPIVVLMAAVMCTIPWFFGHEIGRYWTSNGLILIVIACPCALTISTPVTYAAGLAACAQRGIIVKGGAHLEALGSVDKVVFDKTGTLTQGKFSVIHLDNIGDWTTRNEMLELLLLMEAPSSHPLSSSLVNAAKKEGVSIPKDALVNNHSILKGEGVTAMINDQRIYVGNKRLFNRVDMFEMLPQSYKVKAEEWGRKGGTVGFVGIEGKGIVGAFCVSDAVREEAKDVMASLMDSGIEVIMLTGDGDGAAKAVGRQVGLPESAIHSQLLPEDKLHFVGSLISPGNTRSTPCRSKSLVLMCGDGVNDAPALAVADVGVAMGEGAELAMEMSDITLMDSNLTKLLYAIQMGTKVVLTIKENIFLSLITKLLVVGLTFLGQMTLLTAIAADVGVMLIVTLNGMKLLSLSQEGKAPTRRTGSRLNRGKTRYSEIAAPENMVQSVMSVAEFV